jgi:hypothetical protein
VSNPRRCAICQIGQTFTLRAGRHYAGACPDHLLAVVAKLKARFGREPEVTRFTSAHYRT